MKQPTNKSSRAIILSLPTLVLVTLLIVGSAPPAGAQTNTALGTSALTNNTTGTYNTAVGFAALFLNTTGIANTAVGSGVLSEQQLLREYRHRL